MHYVPETASKVRDWDGLATRLLLSCLPETQSCDSLWAELSVPLSAPKRRAARRQRFQAADGTRSVPATVVGFVIRS